MWAYRLIHPGSAPQVVDVPRPVPRHSEVLIKVLAVGLCHSDLTMMSIEPDAFSMPLPYTLGHECVGRVEEVGTGVIGVEIGEVVAVVGAWGCGKCRQCKAGAENYCVYGGGLNARGQVIRPFGGGVDGALAEFALIDDVRHLVPVGSVDPFVAAPLTDAGITAFHAINRSRCDYGSDTVTLVIGLGGLGHIALQVLAHVGSSHVIGLDSNREALAFAERWIDKRVASSDAAWQAVQDVSVGRGADVVIDFVGTDETLALASSAVARGGDINIVGVGGGSLLASFSAVPHGVAVNICRWGSRDDLQQVLAMAEVGILQPEIVRFNRDEISQAYAALGAGKIRGRAVINMIEHTI